MKPAVFARFLRPATLFAPVAGVLGGAVAAARGWPQPPWSTPLAILSALLLTGYSNGINQIADLATDRINRPERPLPAGEMSLRTAWGVTLMLGTLSLVTALLVNSPFFWCVAVTVPVTTSYSLPPLRFKRIPFAANAAIATPRGMGVVLAGWAAGGGIFERDALVLSAVAWVYIFGASVTKDFADVAGDRATGCLSLPILWGPAAAARYVAPFLVVPFLFLPLAAWCHWLGGSPVGWTLLGLALAALGARAAMLVLRDPQPPPDGSPHKAWLLMYIQMAATHLGTAAVFLCSR